MRVSSILNIRNLVCAPRGVPLRYGVSGASLTLDDVGPCGRPATDEINNQRTGPARHTYSHCLTPNFLICSILQSEYEKAGNCRSSTRHFAVLPGCTYRGLSLPMVGRQTQAK